jgi:two-component system, NarL family, nitrate/nitrite response regulator NarL
MRALIVDDNTDYLGVARAVLRRQGIVVVGIASTGPEALAAARAHEPDVALVDVELGSESGFDVAVRLSRLAEWRTRVILISARSQDDLQDLIAASPAIGFLPKSRLSAGAIAELLDRSDTGGRPRALGA